MFKINKFFVYDIKNNFVKYFKYDFDRYSNRFNFCYPVSFEDKITQMKIVAVTNPNEKILRKLFKL